MSSIYIFSAMHKVFIDKKFSTNKGEYIYTCATTTINIAAGDAALSCKIAIIRDLLCAAVSLSTTVAGSLLVWF